MKVNSQQTNIPKTTNLQKAAKVAGATTAINAGLSAGAVALSMNHLIKNADLSLDVAEGLKDSFKNFSQNEAKSFIDEVPKQYKKLAECSIKNFEKNKEKFLNNIDDMIRTIQNGKIDKTFVKNYGKQILKSSVITGAVVGGIYLVGKTISEHVKAKKLNKTSIYKKREGQ